MIQNLSPRVRVQDIHILHWNWIWQCYCFTHTHCCPPNYLISYPCPSLILFLAFTQVQDRVKVSMVWHYLGGEGGHGGAALGSKGAEDQQAGQFDSLPALKYRYVGSWSESGSQSMVLGGPWAHIGRSLAIDCSSYFRGASGLWAKLPSPLCHCGCGLWPR